MTLKIHDPNAQRSYKDLVYCLTAEVRVTIFGLRCREIGSVWLPDEAVEPFTSRDADRRSGLGIRDWANGAVALPRRLMCWFSYVSTVWWNSALRGWMGPTMSLDSRAKKVRRTGDLGYVCLSILEP